MANTRLHTYRLGLVTGATSGIGAALARELAAQGVALILTGRSLEVLNALVQELNLIVPVEAIALNLGDAVDRQKLIDIICIQKPDLVVNNAGIGLYGEATNYETAIHTQLLELNVIAVAELTLEAIRALKGSGLNGTVLNVSSVAGELPFPLLSTYAASKAFVTRLSESLDAETASYGIRVLASCPGVVATNFRKRAGGNATTTTGGIGDPITPEFAAKDMWKQIQSGQKVRYFDWRYRLLLLLTKLIPRSWVASANKKSIQRIHSKIN